MSMSGAMISKQTFRKKFQGYDPAEVSTFLEEVALEVDALRAARSELSTRVTALETRLTDYTTVEKALQETLSQAKESSAKVVEQARQEAQLIIRDAELRATQIVDRSKNDLTTLKEQVTILGAKKDAIVSRLRLLLNSELELVRALDEGDDPPDTGDQPPAGPSAGKDPSEIDDIMKSLDDK